MHGEVTVAPGGSPCVGAEQARSESLRDLPLDGCRQGGLVIIRTLKLDMPGLQKHHKRALRRQVAT
jgi:hypothetical protein